jgi:hypothetical protein
MKTTETLELPDSAELTLNLGTGMEHFVIAGDSEVLQPLADAALAYDKAHQSRPSIEKVHRATNVAKTVLEAPTHVLQHGLGRIATDFRTKAFDIVEGTDLYGELQRQRKQERVLGMARKIGIVQTTYCQKHERELAKIRKLV